MNDNFVVVAVVFFSFLKNSFPRFSVVVLSTIFVNEDVTSHYVGVVIYYT